MDPTRSLRPGLSLVETLVAIACAAMLLAMVLPAIQSAREASRRARCVNNLRQISLTVDQGKDTFEVRLREAGLPNSQSAFLPLLVADRLLGRNYLDGSLGSAGSLPVNRPLPDLFACPSDSRFDSAAGLYSYLANENFGNWNPNDLGSLATLPTGIAFADEMPDGRSQTALVSERLTAPDEESGFSDERFRDWAASTAWGRLTAHAGSVEEPRIDKLVDSVERCQSDYIAISPLYSAIVRGRGRSRTIVSGYHHAIQPNGLSCRFDGEDPYLTGYSNTASGLSLVAASSEHPGGVNVAFGDTHVALISESVAVRVWKAIGTRTGGDRTHF